MRRGFKADARRLAAELREEVGRDLCEWFDPYEFAELYGIRVYRLSELDCLGANYFRTAGESMFSGALIRNGTGALILENDAHALTRRRATLSHELAHVVLEHEFSAELQCHESGVVGNDDQESEATWLAGELLVPHAAAYLRARNGMSDRDVADEFRVSLAMAKWRMNHSGARRVASLSRAKTR